MWNLHKIKNLAECEAIKKIEIIKWNVENWKRKMFYGIIIVGRNIHKCIDKIYFISMSLHIKCYLYRFVMFFFSYGISLCWQETDYGWADSVSAKFYA